MSIPSSPSDSVHRLPGRGMAVSCRMRESLPPRRLWFLCLIRFRIGNSFSVAVTSPSHEFLKVLLFKACSLSLWRNTVSVTSTLNLAIPNHSRHPIDLHFTSSQAFTCVWETGEGEMWRLFCASLSSLHGLLSHCHIHKSEWWPQPTASPFVDELPSGSPLLYSCDFVSLIILFNDNHTVGSLLNFIFDLLAERSWVGI